VRLDTTRRDLLQFSQLSLGTPVRVQTGAQPARAPRPVEIIRGAQTAQQITQQTTQ